MWDFGPVQTQEVIYNAEATGVEGQNLTDQQFIGGKQGSC